MIFEWQIKTKSINDFSTCQHHSATLPCTDREEGTSRELSGMRANITRGLICLDRHTYREE